MSRGREVGRLPAVCRRPGGRSTYVADAGRIVPQELTRIEYGLRTGSLFRSERWTRFADSAPTVLRMRGLLVPPDMTADNLVVARPPWETGSR